MPQFDIAEFDLTYRIFEKIAEHGITIDQLEAVLEGFSVGIRSRRDRAASHVLLGTDDQGRCLTIPIVPTDDPYVWRPITAWHWKPGEAAILRRRPR